MADSPNSLRRWRRFFSSAGTDIFEVINGAIAVAASDHPYEFKNRRDQIAEKLCTAALPAAAAADISHSYSDDDEAEVSFGEVLRIKDGIVNKKDDRCSETALLESLWRLQSMPMTMEALKATQIGVAVKGLRKHKSEQVRRLARSLLQGWKAMVDEWLKKSTTAAAATTIAQDNSPDSSNSCVVDNDGRERHRSCPASLPAFEAKMEITKRKLHEGYHEAESAKRQRRIQVIQPPPEIAEKRLRTEVRCARTSIN